MVNKKFVPVITYLNPSRDAEILIWLERQSNKSAAIREVMLSHIQSLSKRSPGTAEVTGVVDQETIRQTITNTLSEHLDLARIRQVVEVAVANALSSLAVLKLSHPLPPANDSEPILDVLDDNLVWE